MTGVELYIKDKSGNFHCYKQRHDGYYITDFVKRMTKDVIFCMDAKEIIRNFHDKFFKDDSDDNYHPNGSPLEYGVEIPSDAIEHKEFFFELNPESFRNSVYGDIENYIYRHFSDDNDWNKDYTCGYSDYMVFIDLTTNTIFGIDEDDEDDEDDDEYGNDNLDLMNFLY